MSGQHVLVTFAAPPSFQSSDNCKQVIAALRSQLPLRSIHWRSTSRPSIRTIQELEVTLIALDSLRDEGTSQVPLTLLEKPLLNLFVVTCEDNEVYRTTVKKQIKDWQTTVLPRRNQEWLVVHLVRPDTRLVDRKFFNMKSSVLDKIKADFNVDKRDRCVQLAWTAGEQNPTVWADLISKIKDGLLSALDNSVSSREEELKRSESQRHMPGWNFCTYFILKESLASSYEGINLFEDALQQYNELEAGFMQVLREKNMSWFGSLIHLVSNDDSMPLLSTSKKHYRDFILANTISVFDLRVYILSRQSALLSKLCQPSDICWKAFTFLSTFGRRLREVEPSLPQYFIESWTFSSALSVLDQCDSWAHSWKEMDAQSLARYNAKRGELIELAKSQLDILGIREGFLPSEPPFSLAIPIPVVVSDLPIISGKPAGYHISKHEIISAIGDKEVFYDLYTTISNRAIDMYVKAGRRKFALKIHGSLAVLDIYRGRLSNAFTIFTSLPAHYAPHRWTSLESLMLARAIDTHAALKRPHDREWIHILLAFLKTYVNDKDTELVMSDDAIAEYITGLTCSLREAAEKLDSDLIHADHPVVSVGVAGDAIFSEEEDSLSLEVIVQNRLTCDIIIDEISVTLTGQDTTRLRFAARTDKLSPGSNHLTLNCATASRGVYVLDNSEIQMSRLRFQWNHKTPASSIPAKGTKLSLVRLPYNPRALDVQLRQSHEVDVGAKSRMLLVLSTGHNDIPMATIRLSAPGGVDFDYANAQVQDQAGEFERSGDCIKITDARKDTKVAILVPHTDASRFSAMKIDVKVSYNTVPQPMVTRTLRKSHVVHVSLPLAVNVEDFVRGKRLFSKFTISATLRSRVRLSSADLQRPNNELDGVKIAKYHSSHGMMTVSPENPVHYVFSIESEHGPVLEPLKLVIVYRLLREEVVALIHAILDDILPQTSYDLLQGRELTATIIRYLEADCAWAELYSATGELLIPNTLEIPEELRELFATLQTRLAHSRPPAESPCPWREIRIPVDVPRMNIIAAARIRIQSSLFGSPERPAPIYAGQPVSGNLAIRTSLHWGDPENKRQKYIMRYDLEERVKDWLVCGRKRGEFITRDEETFSVPLTLIALHHGQLTLPKVDVKPLPLTGDGMATIVFPNTDTHQAHGAETVLVLPRGGRSTFVVGMGLHEE